MMKFQWLAILVVSFAGVSVGAQDTSLTHCKKRAAVPSTESDDKKTVVDFLLEIPVDLLGWHVASGGPFTLRERLDRIKVCDEKNGYLEIDNSNFDGDWVPVVALFRRKNRPILLGFAHHNAHLKFLKKTHLGWKDVTSEDMPPEIDENFINAKIREKSAAARKKGPGFRFTDNASDPALIYQLPRKGTLIRAIAGNESRGTELFRLKLNEDRFEIINSAKK